MSLLKVIKYLLLLFVVIIVVMLAVYNSEDILLRTPLKNYDFSVPAYIMIFSSILIGMVIGWVFAISSKLKSIKQVNQNKQLIKALENEVASLKINSQIIDIKLVD